MTSDQIDNFLKVALVLSQALLIGLNAYFSASQTSMRNEIVTLKTEVADLKAQIVVLTGKKTISA